MHVEQFKNCNLEAKRRLQMCAFQIIDKSVFLHMKDEITQSLNQLIKIDNENLVIELNHSIVESTDTRKLDEYVMS